MRNRTFCILLAIFLMAMGTLVAVLREAHPQADGAAAQDVSAAVQPVERLRMPVTEWTVTENFGAVFNEEYGHWTMAEGMKLETRQEDAVCAPLSGQVSMVEPAAGGGSMLTLVCGDGVTLHLGPVAGVRVFEGSWVEQGMVLGSAGERLYLQTEQEGQVIDPMLLSE